MECRNVFVFLKAGLGDLGLVNTEPELSVAKAAGVHLLVTRAPRPLKTPETTTSRTHTIAPHRVFIATEGFNLIARDGPWQHHTSSPSGEQTSLGDFEGHPGRSEGNKLSGAVGEGGHPAPSSDRGQARWKVGIS